MKKTVIKTIIVTLLILIFGVNFCYGTSIIDDPTKYEPKEKSFSELADKTGIVLGVIRTIGIVVSVIALMVIGLKAMTGSLEQRADYKKALPGYVLGLIMVVAITVLPSIIYEFVKEW